MTIFSSLTIFALLSRRRRQPLDQLTDSELIIAFNQGRADAFNMIVNRFERPLYFYILRRVQSEEQARDILQDTFMKLGEHALKYDPTSPLSAWLYTIARNRCIDHLRKKRWRLISTSEPIGHEGSLTIGDTLPDLNPGITDLVESKEAAQRIDLALEEINPDQREVFVFRYVHGLQFNEIADLLSVSENTVKSRMRYALQALRAQLADYLPTLPQFLQNSEEKVK